jgi:hypothetical protein
VTHDAVDDPGEAIVDFPQVDRGNTIPDSDVLLQSFILIIVVRHCLPPLNRFAVPALLLKTRDKHLNGFPAAALRPPLLSR